MMVAMNRYLIISFFYLSLIVLLFVWLGSSYRYHGSVTPMDTFHEGESIGTAIGYIAGKIPYKDVIFVHGVIQDPVRSVLAFKIFGQSISSSRMMDDVLTITAHLLFLVALFLLFQRNTLHASIAFAILLLLNTYHPAGVLGFSIPHRDMSLMLWLITLAKIRDHIPNSERQGGEGVFWVCVLVVISIASFSYSIDRGFYLSFVTLLVIGILFFVEALEFNRTICIKLTGSFLIGTVILGWMVKFAYADFLKFVFLVMPRYKELMDGLVYNFRNVRYLTPVLLIAINVFYLLLCLFLFDPKKDGIFGRKKLASFLRDYFVEVILCILSIVYFRSALGRSDLPHVSYVSLPIFLSISFIGVKHILEKWMNVLRGKINRVGEIAALIVVSCAVLAYIPDVNLKELYRFPLGQSDYDIIPRAYRPVISFLDSHLGGEEGFFTMTNEAAWYYFVNRPCPTKFPVVWFAMPPFYQREIIADLESKNIKFILFRNTGWFNCIDGFTNEERLPLVVSFIRNHYRLYRNINGNEIWVNIRSSTSVDRGADQAGS